MYPQSMARKKKSDDAPNTENQVSKRTYPSRAKTRYIAVPEELHDALAAFAESRSDEDEKKSISWAARVALRKFLTSEGFWPPKAKS